MTAVISKQFSLTIFDSDIAKNICYCKLVNANFVQLALSVIESILLTIFLQVRNHITVSCVTNVLVEIIT